MSVSGDFTEALLGYVRLEIGRVFWNRNQRSWEAWEDPGFDGIQCRSYWWGDEDAPEADEPNFAFEGVEFRWYKHMGRAMEHNRPGWRADDWASWLDRCIVAIRLCEPGRLREVTP